MFASNVITAPGRLAQRHARSKALAESQTITALGTPLAHERDKIARTRRDQLMRANVAFWHFSDMPNMPGDVRSWGQSGSDPVATRGRLLTQSGHGSLGKRMPSAVADAG